MARRAPADRVVALCLDELAVGGKHLLGRTSLVVDRATRARLCGPNGAGKSTLLRALASAARADLVLYLPQWMDASARARIADEVRRAPAQERGRVLSLLAVLGTDPEQLLASRCPSPGDARKLTIARGLAQQVACLLLDEPTNDLDLPSVERIEAALLSYEGALVLVTHDEALATATTAQTWRFEQQQVRV